MRKWIILLILAGCNSGSNKVPLPPPIVEPPQIQCIATLFWELPTHRIDNTILPQNEIAKLTIYMSSANSTLEEYLELIIDIENVGITSWIIYDLTTGDHWFYASVTDLNDLTSNFSNLVNKTCT